MEQPTASQDGPESIADRPSPRSWIPKVTSLPQVGTCGAPEH
jgi:hypothetical protein